MQDIPPLTVADFKGSNVVIGKIEIDNDGTGNYVELPDVIDFEIDTNIENEVSRFAAYSFTITCLNTDDRYFSWNTASEYYNWLKQGRRIKIYAGIEVSSTDYYYQWIIGRVDSYSLATVAGEEICTIEGRDFMRIVLDYKLYSPNTHWGTAITFDTVAVQADYPMPSAWGVSTASYDTKSFDVSSEDGNPINLFFKPDGSKVYVLGYDNDTIFQYSLSTFWDISTASYDSKFKDVSNEDIIPFGLFFKPDGSKVYVLGNDSTTMYQYSLDTPWDISTASYDTKSFDVSGQENDPYSLFFKPDGSKVYVLGIQNDTMYQYSLDTPWDISTASYDTKSFDVSGQENDPMGIFFKPDGSKVYVVGVQNKTIYQYSLPVCTGIYIAYLDSLTKDGTHLFQIYKGLDFGYVETDGLFSFYPAFIPSYNGTDNLKVYYFTAKSIESVVGDILVSSSILQAKIEAITISFSNSNPDTILDSGNNFVIAGFKSDQTITVITTSGVNDDTYTINTVTPGVITLIAADSLTTENAAAAGTVTITTDTNLVSKTEWLANTNYVTPTGKEIDRVWFETGTSAFEAIRLLAEVVQYRFYFDYEGNAIFKPKVSIGTSVDTFSDDCITEQESREDIDEVYNHIIVVGEKRETLG